MVQVFRSGRSHFYGDTSSGFRELCLPKHHQDLEPDLDAGLFGQEDTKQGNGGIDEDFS